MASVEDMVRESLRWDVVVVSDRFYPMKDFKAVEYGDPTGVRAEHHRKSGHVMYRGYRGDARIWQVLVPMKARGVRISAEKRILNKIVSECRYNIGRPEYGEVQGTIVLTESITNELSRALPHCRIGYDDNGHPDRISGRLGGRIYIVRLNISHGGDVAP